MPVTIEGSKGVNGGAAEFKSFSFGVVGDRRNVSASSPLGSSSLTITGDAHLLSDSLGNMVVARNFSLVTNILSTGAGGMAAGQSIPPLGYLAIYHVYNPASESHSTIAVNCTTTKAPEIADPSVLPLGYSFSSLLTIVPVVSSRLSTCLVSDRHVAVPNSAMYANSIPASSSFTVSLLGKYPLNARFMDILINIVTTGTQMTSLGILPDVSGSSTYAGECSISGYITNGALRANARLVSSQSGNYRMYNDKSGTFEIYLTGYEI